MKRLASIGRDEGSVEAHARRADSLLLHALRDESRLFIVDGGTDAAALRARYPDRTRYALVHGSVGASTEMGEDKKRHVAMRVIQVDGQRINVPKSFRAVVQRYIRVNEPVRFQEQRKPIAVTVEFGRRFEPWIESASIPAK